MTTWSGTDPLESDQTTAGKALKRITAGRFSQPSPTGCDHYCRIGDGIFAAISGWPSMKMPHQGDYLGVPATGRQLTLRVMDFYRCANGKIMENWVLLDYLDLFRQMDVDQIQLSREIQ